MQKNIYRTANKMAGAVSTFHYQFKPHLRQALSTHALHEQKPVRAAANGRCVRRRTRQQQHLTALQFLSQKLLP